MHEAPDIAGVDMAKRAGSSAAGPSAAGSSVALARSAGRTVQNRIDRFVAALFLWAFPHWVRPNFLTVARICLIPVVLVLLGLDLKWWGLAVFLVAMSTDFIDGAMARLRDQITLFGTFVDPVADKLLVAALLAWLGYKYLVVQIVLVLIFLELVSSAVGVRILLRTGTARSSNIFGKAKMIVQSVAVVMFLIGGVLDLQTWVDVSLYLLWCALVLLLLSGSMQIRGLLARKPDAG
jgi:CDP-diacylglycerol---glycerol-3-phosphate 3-phosphatidyltransferase